MRRRTTRKLKLYLDTSVWNFFFVDDTPEKRDITKRFFDSIKGEMGLKVIFMGIFFFFVMCSFIYRVEAEISEDCFEQGDLTHIDFLLMDVEKDIERVAIRTALFVEKEKVNFLLEEIYLVDVDGYRFGFDKSKYKGCKILIDFWILNDRQFKKEPEEEQRKKMMDQIKQVEAFIQEKLSAFEESKDLKVRFIAPQKDKHEIAGETLVATYNEGELVFVNRTFKDIFEQERKLKKIK